MNQQKLQEKIFEITESEEWHLNNPDKLSPFYDKLKLQKYKGVDCYLFDFVNTLKENFIGIVKETRFTKIPTHYHIDMEMSYVYEGECTFLIKGQKIHLTKGDLCIIDTDIIHSAEYKSENDIVFNIVFRKSFFTSHFLSKISDKGILGTFLLNAISSNQSHDSYLIFHTLDNDNYRTIFGLMLSEYIFPSSYSISLIEHYFSILFLELINSLHDYDRYPHLNEAQKNMVTILKYIEENYAECSLSMEGIAHTTHFSVSYIYKLLKTMTGATFSQLKLEQQMKEVDFLLRNTSLPITEVIEKVGIKNPTYFYKKFKSIYGCTPKEYKIRANL